MLDLKQPQSLNALSMLDALDQVKALVDDKWLFLPDVASGSIVSQSFTLSTSRMTGLQNDLPLSPAIYGALTSTYPGYELYFYSTSQSIANIYASAAYRLVPIPGVSQTDLLDQKGLTLSAISNLAETGNSADTSDLVVLGGDFSESYWGDPVAIKSAFSYIAEHPWIKVLSLPDLLISPSRSLKEYVPVCVDLLCSPENPALKDNEFTLWQNNAYAQISKLPYSSLSTAAWSTFTMLTAPSKDEKLQTLRWEYRSTVDYLLLAAHWASDPGRIQDCFELSDQPVCVLANDTIFALLSPNGARLVMLFTIY